MLTKRLVEANMNQPNNSGGNNRMSQLTFSRNMSREDYVIARRAARIMIHAVVNHIPSESWGKTKPGQAKSAANAFHQAYDAIPKELRNSLSGWGGEPMTLDGKYFSNSDRKVRVCLCVINNLRIDSRKLSKLEDKLRNSRIKNHG